MSQLYILGLLLGSPVGPKRSVLLTYVRAKHERNPELMYIEKEHRKKEKGRTTEEKKSQNHLGRIGRTWLGSTEQDSWQSRRPAFGLTAL